MIAWNKGLTKETDERVRKCSESKMGFHHTEETKEKLSEINKGKIPINVWGEGHIPWNKGIKGQIAWNKGLTKEIDERVKQYGEKQQGKSLSEETKQKISIAKKGKRINSKKFLTKEHRENLSKAHKGNPSPMKGKHHTKETKLKISKGNKGKIITVEMRKKLSESSMGLRTGKDNWNWKGGVNSLNKKIRRSFKYRQWRSDIFTRDDFTCQECGQRGGRLNAHHIKSFSSILQFYEITTTRKALECEEIWNINNGITLCKECHWKLRGEKNEFNKDPDD